MASKAVLAAVRSAAFFAPEPGGYALPLGAAWLRDNAIPSSATIDVVLEPDGP
jgi:hypothetical protein